MKKFCFQKSGGSLLSLELEKRPDNKNSVKNEGDKEFLNLQERFPYIRYYNERV